VRFFNAIGVNDYYDDSSHVAPALIRKAHEQDKLVVWGSGNQTRALVDARDIAWALIALAESDHPRTKSGKPINIGHEHDISMKDLAHMILDIAGLDKDVVFDTTMPDGYPKRAANITWLREIVGEPKHTPLETSLEDMIADYKRQVDELKIRGML
jgi:GDP-L-fucose synthase